MANILLSAKYSTEAFGAAVQEGMVSRRNVISETVSSLGMTCEAIYVTCRHVRESSKDRFKQVTIV